MTRILILCAVLAGCASANTNMRDFGAVHGVQQRHFARDCAANGGQHETLDGSEHCVLEDGLIVSAKYPDGKRTQPTIVGHTYRGRDGLADTYSFALDTLGSPTRSYREGECNYAEWVGIDAGKLLVNTASFEDLLIVACPKRYQVLVGDT